jgi:hypothetical protein
MPGQAQLLLAWLKVTSTMCRLSCTWRPQTRGEMRGDLVVKYELADPELVEDRADAVEVDDALRLVPRGRGQRQGGGSWVHRPG